PLPCLVPPCHAHRLDTGSVPTRRSSDLGGSRPRGPRRRGAGARRHGPAVARRRARSEPMSALIPLPVVLPLFGAGLCLVFGKSRSEEHTSELQSRFDLVCRLLLEQQKLF